MKRVRLARIIALLGAGSVLHAAESEKIQISPRSEMLAVPLSTSPHPEKQATNESVRKLAIHLQAVKDLRQAVRLTPLREGEAAPKTEPNLTALKNW